MSRFIGVVGYGWSGSSAVVDYFREFENISVPSFEFRLLKDPYGIVDLEAFLVKNWDVLRSDIAIKDFLNFAKILNRKPSRYFQSGNDLSRELEVDFVKLTQEYIDRLTELTYMGNSIIFDYKLSKFEYFSKRVLNKLFNKKREHLMYLSKPSEEKFIQETRIYTRKIFATLFENNKTIVLDQAIPTSNIETALRYFDEIKLITIDRDPRDIYMDMITQNSLIGSELRNSKNVQKYVTWFKTTRKNRPQCNDKVLEVQFEDLVLDYENTSVRIKNFVELETQHKDKKKFFDPSKSSKNIGIWKKYDDQNIMSEIYENLKEYCYG